ITSQLPTDNWYDAIGDPTVADAIMDRIIHTAHRIELTGESVRKMAAYRGKSTKIIITPSVKTF
uniref:ATP-binding protein n=1 Tax=Phocaeicola sp. TaxID=2773926 RepID=UPI003AEFE5AD